MTQINPTSLNLPSDSLLTNPPKQKEIKSVDIKIDKYINEEEEKLKSLINEHKRVIINSNPGTGKTRFIADLCKEKKESTTPGRIIFCTPYLIIQSQFKTYLKKNDVKIDLELNYKSDRKKLKISDTIITSTFKSFHHIQHSIKEDDLVIVDEAHSLLQYFHGVPKSFENIFVQNLYHTKAKLVLMSGTPKDGLLFILNLIEIKIISTPKVSKIKIQYLNDKQETIVKGFAEYCIQAYGSEHLNILYVRDKKKCEKFKFYIEEHVKGNVKIITSDHKETDHYEQLVEQSTIPKDVQFLITTNVLSTGTNIENSKVGHALMFDSNDPTEIKQFAKRFRKKPDITVGVINREHNEFRYNPKATRANIYTERDLQRGLFRDLMGQVSQTFNNHKFHLKFEPKFYDQYFGSKEHLLDTIITRTLIQEAYFEEEITKTYNTTKELAKALNEFSDIQATDDTFFVNDYSDQTDSDNAFKRYSKEKNSELIDPFIKNPFMLLKGCKAYSDLTLDYTYKLNFQSFWAEFKLNEEFIKYEAIEANINISEAVHQTIIEPYFKTNFLKPLLDLYPYIKDVSKTLYFLKSTPLNKQKQHHYKLYFNSKFHQLFNIDQLIATGKITIKDNIVYKDLDKTDKDLFNLIKVCIKYYLENDFINPKELPSLINRGAGISSKKNLPFPFEDFEFNFNSNGRLRGISSHVKRALLECIFIMDKKRAEKKVNGKRVSGMRFISYIPLKTEKLTSTSTGEYNKMVKGIKSFSVQGSNRLINTREHILLELMDDSFYSIMEN